MAKREAEPVESKYVIRPTQQGVVSLASMPKSSRGDNFTTRLSLFDSLYDAEAIRQGLFENHSLKVFLGSEIAFAICNWAFWQSDSDTVYTKVYFDVKEKLVAEGKSDHFFSLVERKLLETFVDLLEFCPAQVFLTIVDQSEDGYSSTLAKSRGYYQVNNDVRGFPQFEKKVTLAIAAASSSS